MRLRLYRKPYLFLYLLAQVKVNGTLGGFEIVTECHILSQLGKAIRGALTLGVITLKKERIKPFLIMRLIWPLASCQWILQPYPYVQRP